MYCVYCVSEDLFQRFGRSGIPRKKAVKLDSWFSELRVRERSLRVVYMPRVPIVVFTFGNLNVVGISAIRKHI